MTAERSLWPYAHGSDLFDCLVDVRLGREAGRDGGRTVVFVFDGLPERVAVADAGSWLIRDRETNELLAFGDPVELHADFWEQRERPRYGQWPRYVLPARTTNP